MISSKGAVTGTSFRKKEKLHPEFRILSQFYVFQFFSWPRAPNQRKDNKSYKNVITVRIHVFRYFTMIFTSESLIRTSSCGDRLPTWVHISPHLTLLSFWLLRSTPLRHRVSNLYPSNSISSDCGMISTPPTGNLTLDLLLSNSNRSTWLGGHLLMWGLIRGYRVTSLYVAGMVWNLISIYFTLFVMLKHTILDKAASTPLNDFFRFVRHENRLG